jgi:hypothetical protein
MTNFDYQILVPLFLYVRKKGSTFQMLEFPPKHTSPKWRFFQQLPFLFICHFRLQVSSINFILCKIEWALEWYGSLTKEGAQYIVAQQSERRRWLQSSANTKKWRAIIFFLKDNVDRTREGEEKIKQYFTYIFNHCYATGGRYVRLPL